MDDYLSCSICFQTFENPMVLNCGHTFDLECIQDLERCPLCLESIKSCVSNWQILNILEGMKLTPMVELDQRRDIYVPVTDWCQVRAGSLIRYTHRNSVERIGWLLSFNRDRQLAEILHTHKAIMVPISQIQTAYYLPADKDHASSGCCNIF